MYNQNNWLKLLAMVEFAYTHSPNKHLYLQIMVYTSKHKAIRKIKSLKARSLPHYETNQCYGFPTQAFMFYDNPSYVSCLFVGTLPHIYHSKKNP